jgi:VanZ family protein
MIFFKQQPPRFIKIFGTIFVLAILTYLHFMTPPSIGIEDIAGIDKLAHLLMFFLTMIWFVNVTSNPYWNVIGCLLVLYALILEWMQMQFFPGRSFEWLDWFADFLGVVVSISLWRFLIYKLFNSSV